MDKSGSNGFFLRKLACRTNNRSYNLTDSSLVTVDHFEVTPSPLTVAVEQGTATFQCQCSDADFIDWRVNGLPLNIAVNLFTLLSLLLVLDYHHQHRHVVN